MRRSSAANVLILIAATLAGCGSGRQAQGPPGPEVSVAHPLRQNVVNWDNFVGRFAALREVEMRARTSGFIQGIHFSDGQTVRAGQLLFTLDPRPAQAQLDIARSQYALAQADFTRAEKLLAANAISKEEHDTRRATMTQAEATQRARALDLEFTSVTAPIAGIVSDRRVDPGNLIAGGTSAGDVLTTIVAFDPIYFSFDASEAHFLHYQRMARSGRAPAVQIRLLDETEYRWSGRLDFTDNALDTSSGMIRLRALVPNGRAFLRPGMLGHVRLESPAAHAALLIPDAAIVTDGARRLVYVVAANSEVEAKAVSLGPLSGGGLRVIQSGISASDRVIVNGIQRARPGARVAARMTSISARAAPEPSPRILPPPPASTATPVAAATSSGDAGKR